MQWMRWSRRRKEWGLGNVIFNGIRQVRKIDDHLELMNLSI